MRHTNTLAISLAATALVTWGATAATAGTPPTADIPTAAGTPASLRDAPVKHVIEIMIENHTFDNLFGGFHGALNNSRAVEQMAMDYQPGPAPPTAGTTTTSSRDPPSRGTRSSTSSPRTAAAGRSIRAAAVHP